MIVEDLMTSNAAAVAPGESLAAAAQLMWDWDCGAIPVVEDERTLGKKVVGIITDRDICMAAWSRGRAPGSISVREAMTRDVFCARPDDSIHGAEALMRANQIRRLPVVDAQGRLIGILSLADIARAAENAPKLSSESNAPEGDLATTLAGICRSHLQVVSQPSAF